MNTTFANNGIALQSSQNTLLGWMLVFSISMLSPPAGATTDAEDELHKAPMMHESLSSHGPMVKVHLVSLHGYLEGQPNDATRLPQLHAAVNDCIQRNNARGVPSKPPSAWPDHVISSRIDTYSAINRSISYSSGLAYSANPVDCSLIETRHSKAKLYSSEGACDIDMRERTAHGACDATGQATASPPIRRPVPSPAEAAAIEHAAATNPAMAKLAAAIHDNAPTASGERKNILGLECEIRINPFDPKAKVCTTRGGSFPSLDAGGLKQSGMTLEMTSSAGIEMRATKAQLDTMVDGAVFTPYLAAGFRVTNTGRHP